MSDAVLDMRFAHYLGEFVDDEGFLEATYQAALQVEKKKALKQAREQGKPAGTTTRTTTGKKEEKEPARREPRETRKNNTSPKGAGWGTTGAALAGVPQTEIDGHKKVSDGCWRCGRTGHRTHECYLFQTIKGTELPPAPWKAAGVEDTTPTTPASRKRGRNAEESGPQPAAKAQKTAAVKERETNLPLWEDSGDSDF